MTPTRKNRLATGPNILSRGLSRALELRQSTPGWRGIRLGWLAAWLCLSSNLVQLAAQNVDTLIRDRLFEPHSVAGGAGKPAGVFYLTDSGNNQILRVDLGSGQTSHLAGGVRGTADGSGTLAQFFGPKGIVLARGGLVVADSGNHTLRHISFEGVVTTLAGSPGTAGFVDDADPLRARFRSPIGLAVDSAGNIYVADSKNSAIRKLDPDGRVTTLAGATNGLFEPSAVAWEPGAGRVWIADTRNHAVKWLGGAGVVETIAGGNAPVLSGSVDSANPLDARFNQPKGLLWGGNQLGMLVSDSANHVIRRVYKDGAGFVVSTYAGLSGDPGRVDGAVVSARFNGPVGLAKDQESGAFLVVDSVGQALRRITPANAGSTPTTGGAVTVNPPTISPDSGYYPMGVRVTVKSQSPNVFYTTDGKDPTPQSRPVTLVDGAGFIEWKESVRDLSFLKLKAFVGTNESAVVSGTPASVNQIGVPRETVAGIGATVVVPIVANLVPKQILRSLQFRVEVVPEGDAPGVSDQFRSLTVITNGFVNVVTPSETATPASISSISYLNGKARGLAISAIGTNANFFAENYAVVAMLAVPVPPTAKSGHQYTIRLLEVSGTSDGSQNAVTLSILPAQKISVVVAGYIVGDSSPGGWYNAGDFGNGDLNNNDVNNAFYAALGIRLPFTFSDVFDAMDVFPIDSLGAVGGDGEIRFLDWQRILRRSLRLDTNIWMRFWSEGGLRTGKLGELKVSGRASAVKSAVSATASVGWFRQASIGALAVPFASPGQRVSVPVFAKISRGSRLSGLMLNAVVQPQDGSAPLTSRVQFRAASDVPTGTPASFDLQSIGYGWNIGAFNPPLVGSNLLGYVEFSVPDLAKASDSYAVQFTRVDGSPDLDTQYDLESVRGRVWIGTGEHGAASLISDEWKLKYFGKLEGAELEPGADPDGDHVSNLQEYLAGTNPTESGSYLSAEAEVLAGGGVAVRWQSVAGKYYSVERASLLSTGAWRTVGAAVLGKGSVCEFKDAAEGAGPWYYRIRVEE